MSKHFASGMVLLTALTLVTGCGAAASATESQSETSVSPLSEFTDLLWGTGAGLSNEERIAQFNAETMRREEYVAACMWEAGFEYQPNPSTRTLIHTEGAEWDPTDRDWVSQFGFGITTFDSLATAGVELSGSASAANDLSPAEQGAWNLAMFGPGTFGDFDFGNWEAQGCQGYADHRINQTRPDAIALELGFWRLLDDIQAFGNEVSWSAGPDDVNNDWAACMAGAGFPGFRLQTDAASEIVSASNELRHHQIENDSTETVLSPAQSALSEHEIEMALADFDCRREVDFDLRRDAWIWDQEAQFVSDHRSDLEALRSALEQRS